MKKRISLRMRFAFFILAAAMGAAWLSPGLPAEPVYISDGQISSAVRAALGRDDLVPANLIQVQTVEGIVSLDGSVENLLAKRRAGELAETVAGVQAVVNRVEVIPLARTDQEIEQDVLQALRFDPFIDQSEVGVTVRDETVILHGFADSWAKRNLIEDVVSGVRGVQSIRNDIDVRPVDVRPDKKIEDEVKARLKYDALVGDSFIDVTSRDGRVSLVGMVKTAAEKRRASQDAWVAGVRSVDVSGLKVSRLLREQPPARRHVELPSDEALERAVQASLAQDPRIPEEGIAIDVANGVVTLSGAVDTLSTKRAVEQDVSAVLGVARILNHLEVTPVTLADAQIEYRIREAFSRDPLLAAADILVSVTEGRAVLTGAAQNSYQISQAQELASHVRGIQQVTNRIHLQNRPD